MLTLASTAMIFNSSLRVRAMYIRIILDAKLLSSYPTLRTGFFYAYCIPSVLSKEIFCTCSVTYCHCNACHHTNGLEVCMYRSERFSYHQLCSLCSLDVSVLIASYLPTYVRTYVYVLSLLYRWRWFFGSCDSFLR